MRNGFGANNSRNKAGKPLVYLREHMFDGCSSPWPFNKTKGYCRVYDYGFVGQAHVLVCTWVHGPKPFPEAHARHLCGKGHLGCFNAECIQWGTAKDNYEDARRHGTASIGERNGMTKLTPAAVIEIRSLKGRVKQTVLMERFGVSQALISMVQSGRGWEHVVMEDLGLT